MKRTPVTVLTGFLGAGKTTLLNRLLTEPGFADSAVIVNEFGAVDVDGPLVSKADERAFASTIGCLCCTVAGDVRLTLMRLYDEAEQGVGPAFSRLVIETTGLADPAPVLHALMASEPVRARYALNGVVTVVDAVTGGDALDRFAEARRQVAVADVVLLSKRDLARDPASARDVAALEARLAALGPTARRMGVEAARAADLFGLAAYDPAAKPPDVAAWLAAEAAHHHHDHPHAHDRDRHGDDVTAFAFTADAPLDAWALEGALERLRGLLGRDLLRVKGLVALDDDPSAPLVVHGVQHLAHPPKRLDGWPAGVTATRLVVIAAGPARTEAPALMAQALPALRRI